MLFVEEISSMCKTKEEDLEITCKMPDRESILKTALKIQEENELLLALLKAKLSIKQPERFVDPFEYPKD